MTTIATFRGGRMLGASWNPARGKGAANQLREQLAGWEIVCGDSWLVATDAAAHRAEAGGHIVATAVPRLFDRGTATLCTAKDLAARIAADATATVASLGAPFRLIRADQAHESVHAIVDPVGLAPMFWLKNEDIAVCASSATLLARLFAAPPSIEAIAGFALFGCFPFQTTPFSGICKLVGQTRAAMRHGEVTLTQAPSPEFGDDDVGEAFSAAVAAMAQAAPHAMLELSGGLDSRLILAALPEAEKAGNLAVTIDESGGLGGDARVARHIASITGISHREIAVPFAAVEEGDILDRTLRRIVEGYDAMANPIDKLPLALVSDIGDTARFGGQNGEIMRGFYYPLQPLKGKPTTKLIADLVDWRLIANDRTSPNLFAQNFASDALASARASMIAAIAGYGGSWGQVLDRVYLDYRMQSWVGNSAGNRFLDRAVLWPFFDSRFLAAALKLDPDNKRDSRASYRILARLSPQLAATPLDNGLIPAVMAHDNLRAKQMLLRAKARKAQRKLMQRIRPRSVAVLGSERVIDGWFRAKRYAHLDIHRLASLGIFNEAMLEAIGTGRTRPDRATLGFLLLCESWLQP